VRARLDAWGLRPVGGTPEAFADFVARDRERRKVAIEAFMGPSCL
jgi:hypothetical protein